MLKCLDPVHTGHHHVEENKVGLERGDLLDGLLSALAEIDREVAKLGQSAKSAIERISGSSST